MKKQTLLVAAVALMCSNIIACSESKTEETPVTTVEITDTNLTTLLLQKGIDTDNDGKISEEEAAAVTALDLSASGSDVQISDITGLEKFVNLKSLVLSGHYISDLTPIEALAGLTLLDVSDNSISTADFSALTLLEELNISGNSFSRPHVQQRTQDPEGRQQQVRLHRYQVLRVARNGKSRRQPARDNHHHRHEQPA